MKETKAIYRCQGCGAWLDKHELVEFDNGALAHTVYENDYAILCGPINLYRNGNYETNAFSKN